MFDLNSLPTQSGVMQSMNALGGMFDNRPQRPDSPFKGMSIQDMRGANFHDMLGQHREAMQGYRSDMNDWRQQYLSSLGGNRMPMQQQPQPQGPVQGLPTPVGSPIPAQQANIMAPGMVGQSYYTQGLKPGATPFDLPTY